VRSETARKGEEARGDPEFGPWLAQALILVVDDEPGMRNFLVRTLGPRCKRIDEAADTQAASRKLDANYFDVVILDNIMPGQNGVDWLADQRATGFFSDAILMTAYADFETAIRALQAGAADFVLKPFRSNQILNAVARCLDRIRLQRENNVLRYELRSTADHIVLRDRLVGESSAIRRVRETLARVAPLSTSVLITGRSGTGKEVAARSDEIGRVAAHLDTLLGQLQERDREQRRWNEELNARVDQRTQELQLANRQLEATTKQLIISEKLAAIGEITAGVAHEINNPVAVMQGNLDVIRALMGERTSIAQTEFRLLDEQIHRISQIVTKLLQFAKPEEYAGYVERHAAGAVISDCLPLVRHLLSKAGIQVVRDEGAKRLVLMNRTELQQVIVNLIVNAIHAMPDGGVLTLRTSNTEMSGTSGLAIEVADTGVGMTPEIIQRIFDPFFTTKRTRGTGLGLSISQTLVTRQGVKFRSTASLAKARDSPSGCRRLPEPTGNLSLGFGHCV
jgi:signal transduction histidine kinase